MEMEDLYKLKKGDKVLVECTVEAVFVQSGMAMVKTREVEQVKAALPESDVIGSVALNKAIDLVKENAVITEVEEKKAEESSEE